MTGSSYQKVSTRSKVDIAGICVSALISLDKDGKIAKARPFSVKVKDTTGAGDNFAAGFLYATFERKMKMKDALRFGNAAGARSCMFTGGVGAKSTYKDIVKFMEGKR